MFKNKFTLILALAFIASFSNAAAQALNADKAVTTPKVRSTESTGNYDIDLGQIHGVIFSVQLREKICSKHFPEQSVKLRDAHISWRNKHLAFIQEMEKAFQDRLWESVGNNKKEFILLRKQLADDEMQYESGLEEVMLSNGEEDLKYQCEDFSNFLNSDVMNLESFLEEQIVVVRKGPPSKK